MREAVLVVDIGTESVRAALVDSNGEILAIQGKELTFFSPRPGWAEQDPEEWLSSAFECIRNVRERASSIPVLALGVSAQMHAVVPVDREGKLLMPRVPIWCDKRSSEICLRIRETLSPKEQIERTANLLIPNWLAPKMRWIREHLPEVYAQTSRFLTAKDYLNFRLTGAQYIDFSEASGSFLFSWKKRTWDSDLLNFFEIEREKLPPIIPSSSVVGGLREEVAAALALPPGLPVVCGAGDMLCLLLGGGMVEKGRSCDVTGTAADVSVYLAEPLLSPRLMNLHHAVDGWISFGILDSGGGSMKWLRDALYRWDDKLFSYAEIDEEALRTPPGAEGLLFFPYLLGERLFGSPWARGVFLGVLPHHHRGHFARAVMEGVCFDLKMSLEEIERLSGKTLERMYAIGGGAKSDLWCQIKADIYGKEVITLQETEGGIMGAAMLAFSGVTGEEVSSIGERWLHEKKHYIPSPENALVYRKQYTLFREFHDLLQPLFERYRREVS
ncbi:MAG: FGGY family carbohydrate kinase [Atribacterota bacterium]